jgi:WD40 repeat protein
VEGKLITQFNHDAKIYSALFSPDGTRVATASADEKVRLWDLQGNLMSDFDKHEGAVYSVVFSPDGSRILSASADKTVKLWYTPEGIMQWLDAAQIPPFIPNKSGIQNDE